MQGLRTTYLCLWQGSQCMRTSWPGMSQECSKTSAQQRAERYPVACIQQSASPSRERTCCLTHDDGKHPDAVTLGRMENLWHGMSHYQIPVPSHTSQTLQPQQGQQLTRQKVPIRRPNTGNWPEAIMFVPVAVETAGTWNHLAVQLIQELELMSSILCCPAVFN